MEEVRTVTADRNAHIRRAGSAYVPSRAAEERIVERRNDLEVLEDAERA
ncbi:hypothetical protein AB0K43_11065 [Kitasatospora sp. NPDC049258]